MPMKWRICLGIFKLIQIYKKENRLKIPSSKVKKWQAAVHQTLLYYTNYYVIMQYWFDIITKPLQKDIPIFHNKNKLWSFLPDCFWLCIYSYIDNFLGILPQHVHKKDKSIEVCRICWIDTKDGNEREQ